MNFHQFRLCRVRRSAVSRQISSRVARVLQPLKRIGARVSLITTQCSSDTIFNSPLRWFCFLCLQKTRVDVCTTYDHFNQSLQDCSLHPVFCTPILYSLYDFDIGTNWRRLTKRSLSFHVSLQKRGRWRARIFRLLELYNDPSHPRKHA
jgi:hypothetical protein